jgi:hypothetical protein
MPPRLVTTTDELALRVQPTQPEVGPADQVQVFATEGAIPAAPTSNKVVNFVDGLGDTLPVGTGGSGGVNADINTVSVIDGVGCPSLVWTLHGHIIVSLT